VEGGAVERLVDQRGARAELVGVDELVQLIETEAEVQRQLVGQLPFVLHINAEIPAEQGIAVDDRKWSSCWIASVGVDIEYIRYVGNVGLLRGNHIAEPQCVRAAHIIGGVELRAVHLAGAGDIGGNTIEEEIVGDIRDEMHVGIAGEK
jgi:hypothetical protein